MTNCKHHNICGLETLDNKDECCILHSHDQNKDKSLFEKFLNNHILKDKNTYDPFDGLGKTNKFNIDPWNMSNFIFNIPIKFSDFIKGENKTLANELKLDNAEFLEEVDFCNCTFEKRVSFYKCKFSKKVIFSHSNFNKDSNFSDSNFDDIVDFNNSKFTEMAGFTDCIFKSADFNNSKFTDVYFKNSEFIESSNFCLANFKGIAFFSGAIFENGSNFSEAIFEKSANFYKSTFKGVNNFYKVFFNGDTNFYKFQFVMKNKSDRFYFEKSIFKGSVNFSDDEYKFEKKIKFIECEIHGKSNFSNSTFKEADFSNSKFKDSIDFSNSKFKGKVIFNETKFEKEVNFSGVEFHITKLIKTKFENGVDFSDVTFNNNINFESNVLKGSSSYFINMKVKKDIKISFQHSQFLNRVIFSNSDNKEKVFSNVKEVDFSDLILEPLKSLVFINADLSKASFLNTDLREAEFTNILWNSNKKNNTGLIIYDEKYPKKRLSKIKVISSIIEIISTYIEILFSYFSKKEKIDKKNNFVVLLSRIDMFKYQIKENNKHILLPYDKLEKIYRDLKINHENRKDFYKAGEFHINEKRIKILNPETTKGNKFILFFYCLFSNYGESVKRPSIGLIIVLILSTFSYFFTIDSKDSINKKEDNIVIKNNPLNIANKQELSIKEEIVLHQKAGKFFISSEKIKHNTKQIEPINIKIGLEKLEKNEIIQFSTCKNFWMSLLHSVRVMLFMKPDLIKLNDWGNFFQTLESILAPFFFALMTLAIRQRLKRF